MIGWHVSAAGSIIWSGFWPDGGACLWACFSY